MCQVSGLPVRTNSSFVPLVRDQDFPDAMRPVLDRVVARMGFLSNAHRTYLQRPEIAQAMATLNDAVMRDPSSTLDIALKRKVAAIVSTTHGCVYCSSHFCAALKTSIDVISEADGMDDDEVRALLTGEFQAENPVEEVCFEFARAAAKAPAEVPDHIYETMKAHLSPEQCVELASVVALWSYYNTLHDSLKVPLEDHMLDESGLAKSLMDR